MRKLVERQPVVDKLSKLIEVDGNKVTFGGNVDIDGNITHQGETVGGGSKLYLHNLNLDIPKNAENDTLPLNCSIITNFNTELNDGNIATLLYNLYNNNYYGNEQICNNISLDDASIEVMSLKIHNGIYPGDSNNKFISVVYEVLYTKDHSDNFVETKLYLDGTKTTDKQIVIRDNVIEL